MRTRTRIRKDSLFAVLAVMNYYVGYSGPGLVDDIFPRPRSNPGKKCLLPDCTILTTHNGGYCSAEHCKLHREMMKGQRR